MWKWENRKPRETAPGHSQKIEVRWRQWVGEKPKTGEGGRWQTAQVGRGDRRRKKNKTGEWRSYFGNYAYHSNLMF